MHKVRGSGRRQVALGEPDPKLTPSAGTVLVAELDRVLAIVDTIDAEVGPIKRRRQGHGAGGLVLSLAEVMLTGGDFLCDLDSARADTAGVGLRAVSDPPSSPTAIALGKRFANIGMAGVERAVGVVARGVFDLLDDERRGCLTAERPTIDLDGTDVEVYGSRKEGVAYNYQGQRCGRPFVATWAEPGWPLAAELLAGNEEPLSCAGEVMERAIGALPDGLGRPRVRTDSGFFAHDVAAKAVELGADFAIAVKRNQAVWRACRQIPPESWTPAHKMTGAEVAVCDYKPNGWEMATRTIVRRVCLTASQVSHDVRSRRRRTIDANQLQLLEAGETDTVYSYSFIITSLDGDIVDIESWFRQRAHIEERFRDAKLGMALRHLPSGYVAVNQIWMWAALLALNISAWIQALGDLDGDGRAHGKRLRRELINIPARIIKRSRTHWLRLAPRHHHGPFPRAWQALAALPTARAPAT